MKQKTVEIVLFGAEYKTTIGNLAVVYWTLKNELLLGNGLDPVLLFGAYLDGWYSEWFPWRTFSL